MSKEKIQPNANNKWRNTLVGYVLVIGHYITISKLVFQGFEGLSAYWKCTLESTTTSSLALKKSVQGYKDDGCLMVFKVEE